LRLVTRWLGAGTALITGVGEIDAANANMLGRCVIDGSVDSESGARRLIVDLSRVNFFGTEGFSALTEVDRHCGKHGVRWVLVPGPEVTRVLRLARAESRLPVAESATAALTALRARAASLALVGTDRARQV